MAATQGRGRMRKSAGAVRARRKGARGVSRPAIGSDERQHLIEACAFFHAEHFRPVEPGSYRAQDLKDATAEIDAVLKRGGRKEKKS